MTLLLSLDSLLLMHSSSVFFLSLHLFLAVACFCSSLFSLWSELLLNGMKLFCVFSPLDKSLLGVTRPLGPCRAPALFLVFVFFFSFFTLARCPHLLWQPRPARTLAWRRGHPEANPCPGGHPAQQLPAASLGPSQSSSEGCRGPAVRVPTPLCPRSLPVG